ncbi:MAG: hypothetical protein WCV68_00480 [Candidatus Paceibacterota bacterium]|jgi:hypothetical protein
MKKLYFWGIEFPLQTLLTAILSLVFGLGFSIWIAVMHLVEIRSFWTGWRDELTFWTGGVVTFFLGAILCPVYGLQEVWAEAHT